MRSEHVLWPPPQRHIAANGTDEQIYTPAPPDHPAASSEGFSFRCLQWIEAWGYGINGGLRGMSDLETPEADMMRDQSGVGAAPATLRPEEWPPGLDPDNPGAAPDTTRGHPRIAGLGRPVSDPVWDDAERVFADCCRLMGRLREQTARGLSLIATLYLESGTVGPISLPNAASLCRGMVPDPAANSTLFAAIFCASVRAVTEPATRANSPPCWTNGIVRLKRSARSNFRPGSRRAAVSSTYTKPADLPRQQHRHQERDVRRLPPMSMKTMIPIKTRSLERRPRHTTFTSNRQLPTAARTTILRH